MPNGIDKLRGWLEGLADQQEFLAADFRSLGTDVAKIASGLCSERAAALRQAATCLTDAARWRALLASEKVSAFVDRYDLTKQNNGNSLLIQFWPTVKQLDVHEARATILGRELLTAYADAAIAAGERKR